MWRVTEEDYKVDVQVNGLPSSTIAKEYSKLLHFLSLRNEINFIYIILPGFLFKHLRTKKELFTFVSCVFQPVVKDAVSNVETILNLLIEKYLVSSNPHVRQVST